jgi:hypothetical protein
MCLILSIVNGVAGRFRTYKGYELCQRPVPSPYYEYGGSFATLLTATSYYTIKVIKVNRYQHKFLQIDKKVLL